MGVGIQSVLRRQDDVSGSRGGVNTPNLMGPGVVEVTERPRNIVCAKA